MIHGRTKFLASLVTVLYFGAAHAAAPKIESVPGEYLVKVRGNQVFRSLANAKMMFGAEEVRTVNKAEKIILVKRNILETPDFSMMTLESNPNVELVEPNYIYRINRLPNDPQLTELWGLKNSAQKGGREGVDISAEQAWDVHTGSHEVVVAVIDTGLGYTHEDLKDNVWTNEAEANGQPGVDDDGNGYVDDIHGYDFANKDGDPMDDHGHGSHSAGTIGAKGDDGKGIVGVNWNVRLMGVKFLTGAGSGTLEDAIRAIDYAANNGAHILSNSWGGGGFTQLLKESIERARDKGVLFVAAAGNNGSDNDVNPTYPATYDVDNIISVAAINNQGQLAYFSNYGAKSVDLAAPGVDVFSSIPGGYETWSGTSMATPHVSGVAALMKANEPGLSYAELKERILKSTRPLGSIRTKVASSGMVNAFFAITNQMAPPDMEDPFNWEAQAYSLSSPHPYTANFSQDFEVTVPGAKQFAVFFERFETERGYDKVQFIDATGAVVATWSGAHNQEFSPTIQGEKVILRFKADDSVNGYGFDISKVAFK